MYLTRNDVNGTTLLHYYVIIYIELKWANSW